MITILAQIVLSCVADAHANNVLSTWGGGHTCLLLRTYD